MGQFGRILIVSGLAMAALGLVLTVGERLGLGRLPGDLVWKRKDTTVHFPLMTSLVVSVVLSVLLNLFLRRK
jgi:hypothetical protein